MRGVAESFAGAGYDVELPRLPGHGTDISDMIPTRWSDWSAEVAGLTRDLLRALTKLLWLACPWVEH